MPRSLRITSPCPMDWNAMRSAEGGRFCEHCRKTVLDLSDCTEAQALERVGSGPACVRMRVDAAGRPLFVGLTVAGVLALAGCGGSDPGTDGGPGAGDGTTPLAGVAGSGGVPVPAPVMMLGAIAPLQIEARDAVQCALEHMKKVVPWADTASYKAAPCKEGWRVVVRRVTGYPGGSPSLADEDPWRVMVDTDGMVISATVLARKE